MGLVFDGSLDYPEGCLLKKGVGNLKADDVDRFWHCQFGFTDLTGENRMVAPDRNPIEVTCALSVKRLTGISPMKMGS